MAEMSRQQRAGLSRKQQRFIDEYVASNGNGTDAARRAGYASKRKDRTSKQAQDVLAAQAYENLRKPRIIAGIREELARIDVDITPGRVQRRLHEISHEAQAAGQFGPAVRSEELLGKSIGMWVDQSLQLSGVLNDSHVAALIEIARQRQAQPIDLKDDAQVERTDE
jgi:hypothetical protein